jgi:hypothetical protein
MFPLTDNLRNVAEVEEIQQPESFLRIQDTMEVTNLAVVHLFGDVESDCAESRHHTFYVVRDFSWLLGRIDEADRVVTSVIKDPNDTSKFRYVNFPQLRLRGLIPWQIQNRNGTILPRQHSNCVSISPYVGWQETRSGSQVCRGDGNAHTGDEVVFDHPWLDTPQNCCCVPQTWLASLPKV